MIPQVVWQNSGKWEIHPRGFVSGRIRKGAVEIRLKNFILKVSFPGKYSRQRFEKSTRPYNTGDALIQIVECGAAIITESEFKMIPNLVDVAKKKLREREQ